MDKERGGQNLESEEQRQIKKDVEKIRPILEKDPDWPLASGQISWEDKKNYYNKRNAVSRLTRKAVRELFPEYKVRVRRGRGTVSNWIGVNYVISDMESSDWRSVIRRTREMLLSVGIQYGSFFPDSGPGDDWTPCLTVSVNHYY